MMETKRTHSSRRSRRLAFAIAPLVLALGALGVWSLVADAWFTRAPAETTPVPVSAPATVSHEPTGEMPAPDDRSIALMSHESSNPPPADDGQAAIASEDRLRKMVVGAWEDEYHGKRRLTVRSDGTATMVVEPSGIGKKLFAERLEFEIEWTFSDGKIVMTMISGEPKSKAKLVLKLYGSRAEYSLVNLDDNQLLLLDADGKTQYDWRRAADESVDSRN